MELNTFPYRQYNLGTIDRFISQQNGYTISVIEFIDIVEQIIPLLNVFGPSFKSLVYELKQDINVLQSSHESAGLFDDLKGLLCYANTTGAKKLTEAVLWINRCLRCFQTTLCLMLHARKHGYLTGSLAPLIRMAYIYHLRSYHSWLDQQIFESLLTHSPPTLKVVEALKDNVKETVESVFFRIASFEGTLKKFLSHLNNSLELDIN
ncbi:uncharacterized protein LOC106664221 [Cimex lectularius]|uniref:Glycolipid transfer protein domain-containing protein n=1 Tax=Cimex lectularius TaxID=79782 RepID=A0A8I6TD08_CIMLE|nr:uncharacterized protein LOC106664221 [Cimex lectularius]